MRIDADILNLLTAFERMSADDVVHLRHLVAADPRALDPAPARLGRPAQPCPSTLSPIGVAGGIPHLGGD